MAIDMTSYTNRITKISELLKDDPCMGFARTEFSTGTDSRSARVERVLNGMGVECKAVGSSIGPVISRIYVALPMNVSIKQVESVSRDLAMKLGVASVNVVSDISFKFSNPYDEESSAGCVAIEIPNENRQVVPFGNTLDGIDPEMALPITLGVDTMGKPVCIDLAKAPHMLVAGQTGSGKSVCINTIIMSLLLNGSLASTKFLLIDPKQVELAPYSSLPNLVGGKVISEPLKAVAAIGWLVRLMEARYTAMVHLSEIASKPIRNIKEYNAEIATGSLDIVSHPVAMDYVVAIVDEFADLMMTATSELTDYLMRIAQKARAVGIHLILATQRPSTKVITGDLKANIPTRISFKVASQTDSMTIIGHAGAEKLLGMGDMLVQSDKGETRVHGCFLPEREISAVLNSKIKGTIVPRGFASTELHFANFDLSYSVPWTEFD